LSSFFGHETLFFSEDVIGKSHAAIKERINNYFYKYVLARGSFILSYNNERTVLKEIFSLYIFYR